MKRPSQRRRSGKWARRSTDGNGSLDGLLVQIVHLPPLHEILGTIPTGASVRNQRSLTHMSYPVTNGDHCAEIRNVIPGVATIQLFLDKGKHLRVDLEHASKGSPTPRCGEVDTMYIGHLGSDVDFGFENELVPKHGRLDELPSE